MRVSRLGFGSELGFRWHFSLLSSLRYLQDSPRSLCTTSWWSHSCNITPLVYSSNYLNNESRLQVLLTHLPVRLRSLHPVSDKYPQKMRDGVKKRTSVLWAQYNAMVATRRLDIAYWLNFEDSLHTLHTSVQHKMFKQQWMYLARKRLCCCCHINSNWSSHPKSTQSSQCFRSDGRGATDHRCLKCPMLLTPDQNLKREGGHQT